MHTSINMHTTDAAESDPKNHKCTIALPKPPRNLHFNQAVKPVPNLKDHEGMHLKYTGFECFVGEDMGLSLCS